MKELIKFSNKKTMDDLINEVQEKCFDIPFGRSQFQIDNFVIAAQMTPERAYRQILLELNGKLEILKEQKYAFEDSEINRDEALHKLKNGELDEFEKRRMELKQRRSEDAMKGYAKLIHDLIVEIEILYSHLKKYPEFTREEFEAGEYKHYETKLLRESQGKDGARFALLNMIEDKRNLDFITQETRLLNDV